MAKSKEEFIMNVLRQGTLTWEGRNEVFRRASEKRLVGKFLNGNDKYKTHWHCAVCQLWSGDKQNFEADHISEVGPFKGSWDEWIARLYVDPEHWQCICIKCHAKKTAKYAASRMYERKRKPQAEDDL